MNYNFFWDGKSWGKDDIVIGLIFREPWMRPSVGHRITIKGKEVLITRSDPDPHTEFDSVTYYVEPVNGNWPYKMIK